MKLSDFPPDKAANLLFAIFQRYDKARERWPFGKSFRTEIYLSIEEARLIYAAGQWLSRYDEWVREAEKVKGSIGVWPADYDLTQCARLLNEKAEKFDKSAPMISLTEKEMSVIESCIFHLDHYALLMAAKDSKPKGNWKKR